MAVQRSDGFVVQSGDPDGPADGALRAICAHTLLAAAARRESLSMSLTQPPRVFSTHSLPGFIDPATGKIRTVPLEIMVKGDKVPQYGETMEDSGRYKCVRELRGMRGFAGGCWAAELHIPAP